MRKLLIFIKKGFLETISYRFSFIFQFLSIFVSVTIWFYITKFLKGSTISSKVYGGDYFSFVLIGIAFYRYVNGGINGFALNMMKEIERGTMESNWAMPTPPLIIVVYSALWDFLYITLQSFIFLLLGKFIFGMAIYISNYLLVSVIILVSIICYMSIGIILSSFILIFKRPEPLNTLINLSFLLFGGVYFPISIFPENLQKISQIFPLTYSLNALRKIFIQGASLSSIYSDLMPLIIFAILLSPLSIFLFNCAVKRNRLTGSLSFY